MASADEALDALRGARQPLVIVLAARGDEDMDAPLARLLETAIEANGARPAHRFVAWAWQAPPSVADFAATAHVRWVLRPSPTNELLEAVRAAASELQAA